MRIVIDMQGAQSDGSRNRGIGRYTRSLSRAIVCNRADHEIILALNGLFPETIDSIRASFDGLLPQDNIRVWQTMGSVSANSKSNDWRRQSAELTREAFLISLKPDIVLVSSLFEGLVDEAVTSVALLGHHIPTAVILYDLIPFIYRYHYLQDPGTKVWYERKLESLRRADLLLAISESSRHESIIYLGFPKDKSVNISTAAHPRFKPQAIDTKQETIIRRKYDLQRPFVLYTGGIDYRKNIEGLIRAYSQLSAVLRSKYQLAIVCAIHPEEQKRLEELALSCGLDGRTLIFTGFVSDEDLLMLYNLCKLFVFPSLHEGFGLPVLEAMSCGRAVIGSSSSSIPEVIGNEEALFDSRNDEAIASKVKQTLTDDMFRADLEKHALEQAQKFTWDKCAIRAIAALESSHAQHQQLAAVGSFSGKKPRLAFVSPLPPEHSGISNYSAELLPELSRYYKIDVIVSQETVSDPWVKANCSIRDEQWLRSNAEKYDRVLYQFGNSNFHQHMFDLLHEIPGTVVLHDFFLSGVVALIAGQNVDLNGFVKELYFSHGYQAVKDYYQTGDSSSIVKKYPCNLSVLQFALGCIVHSEYARTLAQHWYGREEAEDCVMIPLLRTVVTEYERNKARELLQLDSDDFVICCFGFVHPIKLHHRLLAAWLNSSLAKNENTILVFVGGEPGREYKELLASVIHKNCLEKVLDIAQLSKRVRMLGWTDTDTYDSYLVAADIGVQLRTDSRGETSATVLDCMKVGLPTIVNANGSMADLPHDAVWMLPDEFSDEQLVEALEVLQSDVNRRNQLGDRARELIQTRHSPSLCAEKYYKAIEGFYEGGANIIPSLIDAISQIESLPTDRQALLAISKSLNRSISLPFSSRQLLVDISGLISGKLRKNIRCVIEAMLLEWLVNPPSGVRVEPVYAKTGYNYRYARQFTCRLLGGESNVLVDEYIDYTVGDMFIGLCSLQSVACEQIQFYQKMRQQGVQVKYIVFSPQPVFQWSLFSSEEFAACEKWLAVVAECDGVICTSKKGKQAFQEWFDGQEVDRLRPFQISWTQISVDSNETIKSEILNKEYEILLKTITQNVFVE